MSIYEELKNIFYNDLKDWNYYETDLEYPLDSVKAAEKFILEYFKAGSKLSVASQWAMDKGQNIAFRDLHTVNVFFLGILLKQKIDPDLLINSQMDKCIPYDFPYIWFLTALAHDMGYLFEDQKDAESYNLDSINKENYHQKIGKIMDQILSPVKWEMEDIPLNKDTCYAPEDIRDSSLFPCCCEKYREVCKSELEFNGFNNEVKIENSWYSTELKEKYLKYIVCERGHLEHGIIGAKKFYHDVICNYIQAYQKRNQVDGSFMHFQDSNNRRFTCEHFKIFNYIADCISCHNIFMAEEDDVDTIQKYKLYGLEQLVQGAFRKVEYEQNPLLFILCLADAVEPSKRFPSLSNEEVLDNIELDYCHAQKLLKIGLDNTLYDSADGINYKEGVESIEKWMHINIEVYAY